MRRAMLAVVVACGPAAPRANVPTETIVLETGQFHSQFVNVSAGCCRKPAPVASLEAHCEDAAICTATVAQDEHAWPELRVFGARPGKTRVIATYVDPFARTRVERAFAIELVATPRRDAIAVDGAVPRGAVAMHDGARCERIAAGGPPLVDERGVAKWSCERPVAVVADAPRFRKCLGMCPGLAGESYTICVARREGRVAGIAHIADVPMGGYTAYEIVRVDGALPPGACQIVPALRSRDTDPG